MGPGSLTVGPTSTLAITGPADKTLGVGFLLETLRDATGWGTINWSGSGNVYNRHEARVDNRGVFNILNHAFWGHASTEDAPSFNNLELGEVLKTTGPGGVTTFDLPVLNQGGSVAFASSSVSFPHGFVQSDGLFYLRRGILSSPSSIVLNGGVLEGSGEIQGPLENNAVVDLFAQGEPGDPGVPGVLVVDDYTQSPLGMLVITTYPDLSSEQLVVKGVANLAGTLELVDHIGGFSTQGPSPFTIVTYQSHEGEFANVNRLIAWSDVPASVAYTLSSVIVTAEAPPAILVQSTVTIPENSFGVSVPISVSDDKTSSPNIALSVSSRDDSLLPLSNASIIPGEGLSLLFIPTLDRTGTTLVDVVATDLDGATSRLKIEVNVVAVNDPPFATTDRFDANSGETLTLLPVALLGNDTTGSGPGLMAEYYSTYSADAPGPTFLFSNPERTINVDSGISPINPTLGGRWSTRWQGAVEPLYTELYTFATITDRGRGVRLRVDDVLVIDNWFENANPSATSAVLLRQGLKYALKLEYFEEDGVPSVAQLKWSSPSQDEQIVPIERLSRPVVEADQTLRIVSVSPTSLQGGTVSLVDPGPVRRLGKAALTGPGGAISYTSPAGFVGIDEFTYVVTDEGDPTGPQLATGRVVLQVRESNQPPVLAAITDFSSPEDQTAGVSIGVTDDGKIGIGVTLSATSSVLSVVANSGLSIQPNGLGGILSIAPVSDASGQTTITVTATDRGGLVATTSFVLTVTPVNDPPGIIFGGVPAYTLLDGASTGPISFLVTDPESSGSSLSVSASSLNLDVIPAQNISLVQGANGNWTVEIVSVPNKPGSSTILLSISDGASNVTSLSFLVNVIAQNEPPVAVVDAVEVLEDGSVTIGVLLNDTDPDGDVLRVVRLEGNPANGTAAITADSRFITYTPKANYFGSDSFSYVIADPVGVERSAGVNIVVLPLNDAPFAMDDAATTSEDSAVTVNVLANDTDVEGDALKVTTVTSPGSGTAAVSADGKSVVYTPKANFNGSDSFGYTIIDGNGGTASGSVNMVVTPVNDSPLAVDDTVRTDEDTALTIIVLANDTDVDGDTLAVASVTAPVNGTATVASDGKSVLYTPKANFSGSDAFSYTVTDTKGASVNAVVVVEVTGVNDTPVAVNDTVTTPEDTAVTVSVLANDTDMDGDTLAVGAVTVPANGTATVTGDGKSVLYTPKANFNGSDSFGYTVIDSKGGNVNALVSVSVTSVNDTPLAANDTVKTDEDTAATVVVLANDTDVDEDTLTVTAVTAPSNGSATVSADGKIVVYTPKANFVGGDSFGYTVNDGQGGSATGLVSVEVISMNDVTIAVDDAVQTPEDTVLSLNVLDNDTDVDGDDLRVTAVTEPANGSATISSDAKAVIYAPKQNFHGPDTFRYTVSDGQGGSASAVVSVVVTPANDSPVALNDAAITK